MSEARKKLGWDGGQPPDIENLVGVLQGQIDEIAADIVALTRGPMTAEAQNSLMGKLLGWQVATLSLIAAGYALATAPSEDEA